ncbi:hypothetical protein AXF42_Ash015120 [Apostasia shenzhenica]|uniref:Uncharacterized protein n=1 Tax=Apostasia shenzhenica TaxID=1088818 RepID=A0A2I0AQD0_9ASPA|nr:hypothetical protein AXF42_Ash015120 [Apostasia shenzhenica]
MAHGSEDSDSSPRTPSSSSSSNSRAMQPAGSYADLESPNTANQSSDEGGSSDGVLVELPGSNEQERGSPADPDTGILVNIDGSVQEQQEREDLFVDASDQLGSGVRTPHLVDSAAMADTGESFLRISGEQTRLDAAMAECRKYKEEREAFGREVLALRFQLQDLINRQLLNNQELVEHHHRLGNVEAEHDVLASPTRLLSMVNDCSNFLFHLKDVLDQRLNSVGTMIHSKDEEIKHLDLKVMESVVSQVVLTSYLGSVSHEWSDSVRKSVDVISRFIAALDSDDWSGNVSPEEFLDDGFSSVEKRIILLVENHKQFVTEIRRLGKVLEEIKLDSLALRENEFGFIFSVAGEELLHSKRKEASLTATISELKEENRKMVEQIVVLKKSIQERDADMSKAKTDLEQSEARFLATKERLGMAVTKGKALVQHRDSLKLSLAEKTSELDKCMQELEQKSRAIETMEASTEELKKLIEEKTSELEKCLVDLQEKSNILESTEASFKGTNQSLLEKMSELDKCSLELQQKNNELEITTVNAEELKQSLIEKTAELDKCLLELQQKTDGLENTENTTQLLRQSLVEKDIQLEHCLLELQEKSDLIAAFLTTTSESQNLVSSLQELASERDKVLKDIEEITNMIDYPQDIISLEIVDRIRWIVNKKITSDQIFEEHHKFRDTLASLNVPEDILSSGFDSEIDWLVKSVTNAKDEIINAQLSLASKESELMEAHKEIDGLAVSLLKEKEEKNYLKMEYEELNQKFAGSLASVCSEKEKLIEVLREMCSSISDDQLYPDLDTTIEKCIIIIRRKLKLCLTMEENLERFQFSLCQTHLQLALCEKILEEEENVGSKLNSLSDELEKASSEISTLRNEKETMQKDLNHLEERNSLLRDKLSMAVKKGKGLVSEREGFKQMLDGKNSEIEKLKEELQLQESSVLKCQEQIKSLSLYPEQTQKLEADITTLNDQRKQCDLLLQESNDKLHKLVGAIDCIAIHSDRVFEVPHEKVNWLAEYIIEVVREKASVELELEKLKGEANLCSSSLADAMETIKSLQYDLHNREKLLHHTEEEKNAIQFDKFKAETELQKIIEESYEQENKLADAHKAIKSLEDALSQAGDKIAALDAKMEEAESEKRKEITALNAKLAECMTELTKTQLSSENRSAELYDQLAELENFIKMENLFPFMIESLVKKVEDLRHIGSLILDIHDHFVAGGSNIHSEMQSVFDFGKLSSPDDFEELIKDNENRSEDTSKTVSYKVTVENLHMKMRLVLDRFRGLSRYMDDRITLTSRALQAAKHEFICTLELNESLKLDKQKLEVHDKAQEFEISALRMEAMKLLSACNNASLVLQCELDDFLSSDTDMVSVYDKGDESEYAQAAENLLLAARGLRIYSQNLLNNNREMKVTVENLKNELNQALKSANTAIQERNLSQEKVLKLESDVGELETMCDEMKGKITDYQSKGDIVSDKHAERIRLVNSLTAKSRDELFSKDQEECLFNKLDKMAIPSQEFESQNQKLSFSSPLDKLFHVVDKYSELQERIDSLTLEKEDMQLILASSTREIEQMKSSAHSISIDHREFELTKRELTEVMTILEKIKQNLPGSYHFQDLRTVSATDFLPILERHMLALSADLESSNSKVQELGTIVQAKDKIMDELSGKIMLLENSHARPPQPDVTKERMVFESSTTTMGPEITEIEDTGPMGIISKPSVSASTHARTTRKGSTDHLVLSVDSDSVPLITPQETDDKGHVFKSLNTSGLIPKQGRLFADRVDGIWVSGGRVLMSRPGARLGLIAYWIFLHIWFFGSIL